ncbi:MAG: hypothetical protein Q8R28_19310 [Dehalococcoidia bacterium]|nr:hypothetical protein [Dehalococcoidia bacterium]
MPRQVLVPLRKRLVWLHRGYQDGKSGTPYANAPGNVPPDVPYAELAEPWQMYLDGWVAGVNDSAAPILRSVRER